MMSGIRGRNTKPELTIRSGLHRLGFRYRLHDRKLPGAPDLVFAASRAVLLVNGCFWHGHACHLFRWPASREAYWREKIAGNIRRDLRNRERLANLGWRIGEVWECQLKGPQRAPIDAVIDRCTQFLASDEPFMSIGAPDRILKELAPSGDL